MSRSGENVYKRKDGRWEARYIKSRDDFGKALYGYVYAESYVGVKKKRAIVQVSDNNPKQSGGKVLREVFSEWLQSKKKTLKESTYVKYDSIIRNHLLPYFGEYKVHEPTTQAVENYAAKLLLNGLSGKTVNDVLYVFKSIMKYAENNGEQVNCTIAGVRTRKSVDESAVLTPGDCRQLTEYLLAWVDTTSLCILFALYLGMRIGEICALKWSDISVESGIVSVRNTIQRLQNTDTTGGRTKIIITPPKSVDSEREIPLPSFLLSIVKELRSMPEHYVLSGTSCPIEPRTLNNRYKSVLKQCEIAPVKFHGLRHTFATRCIECGFDVKTLSEILGHSTVRITLDRYVHTTIEQKRANMSKLIVPSYSPSEL